MKTSKLEPLTKAQARSIWLRAQKLDQVEPFGHGPKATTAAVEHLGYVQIDTINVIERCHHHILYNRIPKYRRGDLHAAQSQEKSVFEYWTHALSYVPTKDLKYFLPDMRFRDQNPGGWFASVSKDDVRRMLRMIKRDGPISIRDIEDDVLVEKDHEWASRKPSKKVLQRGFYSGKLVISERIGMLKKYELFDRHFSERPRPASAKQILDYLLDRTLRSQGVVSLDSICHLQPKRKPEILKVIEARMKRGELLEVRVPGLEKVRMWIRPDDLDLQSRTPPNSDSDQTHLLSPFDPLVIQRKRLHQFFDYEHRFEAYLPKEKRVFGYFALPVIVGDVVVAAIDIKTDRAAKKLLIQKWTWTTKSRKADFKKRIEAELHNFAAFQLNV